MTERDRPDAAHRVLLDVRGVTRRFGGLVAVDDLSFEVSRHRESTDARSAVLRGDELVGERTVHLGPSDTGALLGEELRLVGPDETYEAALRRAVEVMDL